MSTIPNNIPCVTIAYAPTIVTHGESVTVTLKSDRDCDLTLKVLTEEKECLVAKTITYPKEKTIAFNIPNDWRENDYELRIVYQDWILASEILEVVNEEEAKDAHLFTQGLNLQSELQDLLTESKDYNQAMKLQEESANYYEQSGHNLMAAKTWENLAGYFYELRQFELADQCLIKSLGILINIKDLEAKDKKEIIAIINRELSTVRNAH